jgi:[acyl-carrier-protein] S-malonyltransferase
MSTKEIAFVFPGQGSQSAGMLSELALENTLVKEIFGQASDTLGYDLWDLVQNNPDDKLNKTEFTQPALLTASYAIWQVWNQKSENTPKVLAGHSLGEYTALVCAEVVSLEDAVALVADRGKYMQAAVPEGMGAMAAILGLENEQVISVCENASSEDEIVSAANFNSTGQIVIAGHKQAVEKAILLAKETGAKRAMLLPVSVPSHCALMHKAAEQLAVRMEKINFSEAKIPIIQNVDLAQRISPEEIKLALLQQLHQPVRWVETIEKIHSMNISTIIECGPGKVLTGLIKRINRSIDVSPVFDPDSLNTAITGVQT